MINETNPLEEWCNLELARVHVITRIPYETLKVQFEEHYLNRYMRERHLRGNEHYLTFWAVHDLKEEYKGLIKGGE